MRGICVAVVVGVVAMAGAAMGAGPEGNLEKLPLPEELKPLVRTAKWKDEGGTPVLKGLQISDRPLRAEDLEVLKKYPTVRGIDFQLVPLDGKGIERIVELKDLERLAIYKCFELKDKDFVPLAKLTKLHSLNLSGTGFGDEGLKAVCTLPELEYLNIGHTKVSDAGLAELKKLKKLKVLVAFGPYLSPTMQDELKAIHPNITFGDPGSMPSPIFGR